MTPAWKYPVVMVAIAIAWKLILLMAGLSHTAWDDYGTFLPVLLILLAIVLTAKKARLAGLSSSKVFRHGLQAGLVFTLFFSGFLLLLYLFMIPEYFSTGLYNNVHTLASQGAKEEDLINYYQKGRLYMMNPMSNAMLTFFALMFISMLYAAVVTFLTRKKIL